MRSRLLHARESFWLLPALLGLGARVDQDGTTVTATSRAVLRPDRTASFLLLGFGSPGEPTGFALDGMACATE